MLQIANAYSKGETPPSDGFSDPRLEKVVRNFADQSRDSRRPPVGRSEVGRDTFSLRLMDSKQLEAKDLSQSFLVKNVLIEGQHCIVGGPKKCLKTGTLVDLAVSLSSATPFLSHPQFDVPRKLRVCLLSGESGLHTLRETARRVCESRGLDVADTNILWGSELPQLANPEHLRVLEKSITDEGVNVLMVDPVYLCLLGGSGGVNPANVFAMGTILKEIGDVGTRTGCTLLLAHHTRKRDIKERFRPTDLDDLAMSGFAEWARQWLLLGRRREYGCDGKHELWFNVGGSSGHSGSYAVNIDEGIACGAGSGRQWSVCVEAASEAISRRQREKQADSDSQVAKQRENLLSVLTNYPNGETKSFLRKQTKPQPSSTAFDQLLQQLVNDGQVEPCKLTKNGRSENGFRLLKLTADRRSVTVG
jgi:hypothetical protein